MSMSYFIVFLIGISLMTNDAEHIFMSLMTICISYFRKCLFKCYLVIFKILLYFLIVDLHIIFKNIFWI